MMASLKHTGWMVLLLVLAACGSKDIGRTEVPQEPKPGWALKRPVSPSDYIGIGIASKALYPLDYQQVAKKNALNDLASEISVLVQGETFLNQLEVNRDFEETYMSQINTTTSEQIEGYQVAGTWENDGEYWVFYRLSRAKHAQLKAEKKRMALDAAKDYYLKAKDARIAGSISQSVDLHLQALLQMKDYWAEANPYVLEGSEVFLDNEIYTSLRSTVSGIRIDPNFNTVVLDQENGYVGRVNLHLHLDDQPLRGVPVVYHYEKAKYSKPVGVLTSAEGDVVVEVRDADPSNLRNRLHCWIDLRDLIGEVDRDPLLDPIVNSLQVDEIHVPIEYVMPAVFMQSSERTFGEVTGGQNLANTLRNELTQSGWRFASGPGDADLLITLEADTRDGGMSQGFHVSYLEMHVVVTDAATGQVVYGEHVEDIKGLHLNTGDASTEAYKKARKRIEKEIAKALMAQLL